jgi:hypothetical protein
MLARVARATAEEGSGEWMHERREGRRRCPRGIWCCCGVMSMRSVVGAKCGESCFMGMTSRRVLVVLASATSEVWNSISNHGDGAMSGSSCAICSDSVKVELYIL